MTPVNDEPRRPLSPEALRALVEHRSQFVAFVERRTRSRADAEEIVQSAFARSLEVAAPRADESAVPWFYRVLRNAIVDQVRRRGVERRAIELRAADPTESPPDEGARTPCGCVTELLPALDPRQAALIARIDLEGASVEQAANEVAITPGNARVRLHRARRALRAEVERACGSCAEDGCRDCDCESGAREPVKASPRAAP